MTTKNKVALFVVLLLLAGGGTYWYTKQKGQQEPSIKISNKNIQKGTVDFEMSYQGQKVSGTAYLGNVYKKVQGGITFIYEPKASMSPIHVQGMVKSSAKIVFAIYDEQNNGVKAQSVVFDA